MPTSVSSQLGFLQAIFDWILQFLQDLVGWAFNTIWYTILPLIIPFIALIWRIMGTILYAMAMVMFLVLDFLELFFGKLIGIGENIKLDGVEINSAGGNDLVLTFINQPEVQDVFWALAIVALVLLFVSTGIAILRTEYNEKGENSKGPIIGSAIRAFALFFTIPLACTFGIIGSNYLLRAVYYATKQDNKTSIAGMLFGAVARDSFRYSNIDAAVIWTFSSIARLEMDNIWGEEYGADTNGSGGLLRDNKDLDSGVDSKKVNELATIVIDIFKENSRNSSGWPQGVNPVNLSIYKNYNSFANKVKNDAKGHSKFSEANYGSDITMGKILQTKVSADQRKSIVLAQGVFQCYYMSSGIQGGFSIYNFDMVWYFFDTVLFNYILLIAIGLLLIKALAGLCMGIGVRLFELVTLFAISPPIVALMPLDNGNAFKKWTGKFVGKVLGLYGGVVAINMFFMIYPIIERIEFFSDVSTLPIQHPYFLAALNYLPQCVLLIAAANSITGIAKMIADLIGAEDSGAAGTEMMGKVMASAAGAAVMAGKGYNIAGKVGGAVFKAPGKILGGAVGGAAKAVIPHEFQEMMEKRKQDRTGNARNAASEGGGGGKGGGGSGGGGGGGKGGGGGGGSPRSSKGSGAPSASGKTPGKSLAQARGAMGGNQTKLNRLLDKKAKGEDVSRKEVRQAKRAVNKAGKEYDKVKSGLAAGGDDKAERSKFGKVMGKVGKVGLGLAKFTGSTVLGAARNIPGAGKLVRKGESGVKSATGYIKENGIKGTLAAGGLGLVNALYGNDKDKKQANNSGGGGQKKSFAQKLQEKGNSMQAEAQRNNYYSGQGHNNGQGNNYNRPN